MNDLQGYRNDHPIAYRCWVGLGCAALTFLILVLTLSISGVNENLLLRPTSGLFPALSVFFGWPAIIGCVVGSDLAQWATGASGPVIGFLTIENLLYLTIPYLLWYAIMARSRTPYPRLDSAGRMALFLGIIIVITFFDAYTTSTFNQTIGLLAAENDTLVFVLYVNNDFLFSVFLGIPLLIVLERSPFVPLTPPWIHVPYRRTPRMPLSQKMLLFLLVVSIVIVVAFIGVNAASDIVDIVTNPADHDFTDLLILINAVLLSISFYLIIMLILSMFVMRYVEVHFSRPIERVANASSEFVDQMAAYQTSSNADRLAPADIDTSGTKPTGEIADLITSSNTMRRDLVTYMEELERTTANAERLSTELEIASSIQQGAVSHDFASYRDRFQLDIATMLRPAREVGGDFYDVFDVGDASVGIVIADVSGKGMPAALYMMRALAEIRDQMRTHDDIGEALTIANRSLCDHNDAMLFVTVFAAVLDTATGQLSYANAGHNPPWLRSRETGAGWLKAPPGLVMGGIPTVTYKTQRLAFAPGDALFLYTDGVPEATIATGELFGDARMETVLRRVWGDDASVSDANSGNAEFREPIESSAVVDAMITAVDAFAAGEPQFDDITMMSIVWDLPVATLALPPDDAMLPQLFAFVAPFCSGEGRTKRMNFEVRLVLEELFVNIAHYGFPEGQPREDVIIEIAVDEERRMLSLTLSDAGIPYDPLSYESQKVEPGVEHRIGGLGILLVREYVDTITYERTDGLNILHLEKSFV